MSTPEFPGKAKLGKKERYELKKKVSALKMNTGQMLKPSGKNTWYNIVYNWTKYSHNSSWE